MTNKKVWESLLLHDTKNSKPVDVSLTAPYPEGHVAFQDKYQAAQEIPKAEYPNYIYFKNRDTPKKKKDNLPDIFWGHLGLVFVSGAMRDLMQDFNFGRTRFIEMPFFEHDQKTPFRGRWYLMHILENHQTLVPKESKGLRPIGTGGGAWKTWSTDDDKLAVDPTVVGDLDFWMDTSVRNRVFFSDRLKVAIKSSGLNARWLGFRPCKVISRPD